MTEPKTILEIKNLQSYFKTPNGIAKAVDGVSFDIKEGEIFALVGESGCGKSVTALSILGLLQKPAGYIEDGEILLDGKNLVGMMGSDMRKIRGADISMIFQEPMTSLNPVFTIGQQLSEVFILHQNLTKAQAKIKSIELLDKVKIPDAEQRFDEYPHQLSGGMKQRVMIAMALGCNPKLLIADEPTTALDVTIQAQVLSLLLEIREEFKTAILLVTHNLGIVNRYADRVGVMYAGRIAEIADKDTLLTNPKHPYTVKLIQALPTRNLRGKQLNTIQGNVPPATNYGIGCRFFDRCPIGIDECKRSQPPLESIEDSHITACFNYAESATLLNAENIVHEPKKPIDDDFILKAIDVNIYFPIKKGIMKKTVGYVKAVDGFNLNIVKGKTTALVGESGCGKTTFGKSLVGLNKIMNGVITFNDLIVQSTTDKAYNGMHKNIQMIFQDPYSSLNPRMRVRDLIMEGPNAQGIPSAYSVEELLNMVAMDSKVANRFPHEFSGGQRQRISIARSLALSPDFIVCDEATSALDVSVQAQVLNILKEIQDKLGLTYLMITHDLSVVEYMADNIAVMYLGRVVEEGPVETVLDNPKHPYTKALLEAVPRVKDKSVLKKLVLKGDVPSPSNPPKGCHFNPRCEYVTEECLNSYPEKKDHGGGHFSRCFLNNE